MTKKRRTSNRSKYINYQELEQYGLGSFLKDAGRFTVDMGLSAIPGGGTVINQDDYSTSFGRKLGKVSGTVGDVGTLAVDSSFGGFGATDVIGENAYDTKLGENLNKYSDKYSPGIGKTAVTVIGGIYGGPSGAAAANQGMTQLQGGIQNAQGNSPEAIAQRKYSKDVKRQNAYNQALAGYNRSNSPYYSPVYRCGGRLRMAYGGEVPPSNGDIYNYSTGYSGQQLAPHSELTGTIHEITIPKYRYATNSQPSGYYRTMTTRNPDGVVNTREFTDKGWEDFLADPYNTSLLKKDPRYKHLVTPKKAMGGTLNYDGQYHSGPDGGVPVDGNGNPNSTNPVALVEKGEVSYRTPDNQTYIFSNTLNLDKNKSFAKEAKRIQSRYRMRLGDNMTAKHDDIAMRSYQRDMNDLMQKQELVRNVNGMNEEETPEFKHGGLVEKDYLYNRTKDDIMELNAYKSGGWIQKTTKSIERRGTKGVCTGSKFGSSSCPAGSKRYNLAKTFRKMAKARKKEMGGELGKYVDFEDLPINDPSYEYGGGLPMYAGDDVTPTGDMTLPDWMRYTPEYNGTEVMPQVDMSTSRYNYTLSELGIDYTPDYTALNTSMGTQQGTTNWKPYSGMSLGSAVGLAAPIIGNTIGLINNSRNRNLGKIKVDASAVTPQRVNLERERASAREQANLARANARRALREGTTPAQYLANVGNTEMGIQRGLGQQLGESYQREEALNAQMRENAMARNDQNRYMKMQADMYNSQLAAQNSARRQQYMNNMLNAVNQWNAERVRSKENAAALNMMYPDYTFMEAPENPNTWWGRNFGRRMYSKQANQYYNG